MELKNPNKCDFIIAGMGCAGLSFAMQLRASGVKFNKVILVDQDLKDKNDRTWCFWTKQTENWFDPVVFKKWEKFTFKSKNFHKTFNLAPYRYLMIRGIDFYNYCLTTLKADSRFEIVTDKIENLGTRGDLAFLNTETRSFWANYLFNSAFRTLNIKASHTNYIQHFKGWLVETASATFDPDVPVFMDFDVEQHNDCRFIYILPFSANKALVEYTGFSKNQLSDEEYDLELKNYLEKNLAKKKYTILETEQGKIPMYESDFINAFGNKVINIGTAGGYSKPSTGYTFYFIQKNIEILLHHLQKPDSSPVEIKRKGKYAFYDKVFMDVIAKKELEAQSIYGKLFQKNLIQDLLAFLNEESTLGQDLKIMNSVPKTIFGKSALKKIISWSVYFWLCLELGIFF